MEQVIPHSLLSFAKECYLKFDKSHDIDHAIRVYENALDIITTR